jgi:hypothetical protein
MLPRGLSTVVKQQQKIVFLYSENQKNIKILKLGYRIVVTDRCYNLRQLCIHLTTVI